MKNEEAAQESESIGLEDLTQNQEQKAKRKMHYVSQDLLTPLLNAIIYFPDEVETFLNDNVDINCRNGKKLSPLTVAALYRPEVLKTMLRVKKNDICFDLPEHKQNILHLVAYRGSIKSALYLIHAGADVNTVDCKGSTPLHYAAYHGRIDMLALFLNNGAVINKQNDFGNTPFHYAVRRGNLEGCKLLWERGADKNIKNQNGLTALDLYKNLTDKALPIEEWKEEKRQKLAHFRQLCKMNNHQ